MKLLMILISSLLALQVQAQEVHTENITYLLADDQVAMETLEVYEPFFGRYRFLQEVEQIIVSGDIGAKLQSAVVEGLTCSAGVCEINPEVAQSRRLVLKESLQESIEKRHSFNGSGFETGTFLGTTKVHRVLFSGPKALLDLMNEVGLCTELLTGFCGDGGTCNGPSKNKSCIYEEPI